MKSHMLIVSTMRSSVVLVSCYRGSAQPGDRPASENDRPPGSRAADQGAKPLKTRQLKGNDGTLF